MGKQVRLFAIVALLSACSVAHAQDARGTWEVVAMRGGESFLGTWLVGSEGDNVFGVSQWACCPGFRVDRMTGLIEGGRIEFTRHIVKQGSPSGTQQYVGTLSGNTISGTWSGLGDSGNWTAKIRR